MCRCFQDKEKFQLATRYCGTNPHLGIKKHRREVALHNKSDSREYITCTSIIFLFNCEFMVQTMRGPVIMRRSFYNSCRFLNILEHTQVKTFSGVVPSVGGSATREPSNNEVNQENRTGDRCLVVMLFLPNNTSNHDSSLWCYQENHR